MRFKIATSLAIATLACVVVNMTSINSSRALDAGPRAFIVAEGSIHDMPTFTEEYGPKVPPTLQPFGGRFVVRGGKLKTLEGGPPGRFVIIAFDNVEKALGWYNSPDYPDTPKGIQNDALRCRGHAELGSVRERFRI
jgi:uncharacterized protein (DUF1330 family)